MSDIRIKMAKDLRDMSDMVGDLHWMAAKAVEDLIKKDVRIAELDSEAVTLKERISSRNINLANATAELAAIKAQGVVIPRLGKFKTSEGGRSYVAEFFKTALQRHDFAKYINERLAADFACALADGLYQLNAAPVARPQVVMPRDAEKSFLEWASAQLQAPTQLASYMAGADYVAHLNAAPAPGGE